MKMEIISPLKIGMLFCLLSIVQCNAVQSSPKKSDRKIIFLKSGDIWQSDIDGSRQRPLTFTKGKIVDYRVSKDGKFLSYSKILKYVEDWGIHDGPPPKVPFCSIVIVDGTTMKQLDEIHVPEDEFEIYMFKWITQGRLICGISGGAAFDGYYKWTVGSKGAKGSLDKYWDGDKVLGSLSESAISEDMSVMVYTLEDAEDYLREVLCVKSVPQGTVEPLISKRSISFLGISRDKRFISFMGGDEDPKNNTAHLVVYDRKDDTEKEIWSGVHRGSKGWMGESSWSFGDRYLMLAYFQEGMVFDVENPKAVQIIKGHCFDWVAPTQFLVGEGKDLFIYDAQAKKKKMFIKNASNATCLGGR